jgi:hypothetical protein
MPAGSTGQDSGIAARHNRSAISRAAAALSGRICHSTQAILAPRHGTIAQDAAR